MEKREDAGISILIKIAGLSSGFVLIAILVLSVVAVSSMNSMGRKTALIMAENKIRGDVASFHTIINDEYGVLSLAGGILTGEQGQPLNGQYDLIDRISTDLGIVATIFVPEGSDYKRVTTSIRDASGQRAVNTMLGTSNAAYNTVNAGQLFIGEVNILGKPYLAGYQPFFAGNSRDIIGILFVGIEISAIDETVTDGIYSQIRVIIAIALAILFAVVLLNILVFKQVIVRPIRTTIDILQDISEGDLTKLLTVKSRDEIGSMAKYFNRTIDKIKTLIGVIKRQSASLLDTGNRLASNMTKSTAAIDQITANIQSLKGQVINQSSDITGINTAMEQITTHIERFNEHIEKQSANIAQSSSAIEETLANIQAVTGTLIKNTDNVNALAAASEAGRSSLQEVVVDIQGIAHESEGLLEINAVMENIASQTNLLSMNAAIEAAHAGEAGKGFAVVADEIRKLAESSGEQSKTISAVLKKIVESINKIDKSTGMVLEKFEAIDLGVKTVSAQEEHIRNAMEEQNAGSKQILDAITQLNNINQVVKDSSIEVLTGSKQVIQESKSLGDSAQQLSDGMSEMAAGSEEINAAINGVNIISGENKESINHLVQEVEHFKVE